MFVVDIKKLTEENEYFRKVLHTGKYSQLVAMSIPIAGEIGKEVHPNTDQLIFIICGKGEAILNGEMKRIKKHDVIFVPAGAIHNFKNTGDEQLKIFTVYAPSEHPDGIVDKTKGDAKKRGV